MYELTGQVAIVTGAANPHGIGRAIALRLAHEGADVVVNDRSIPPDSQPWIAEPSWRGIESVKDEIEACGRRSLAVTADVRDRAQVERMVNEVIAAFGQIDILVNNAKAFEPIEVHAALSGVPFIDLADDDWDETLSVNLKGPLLTCQAVARQMIAQGGGGKIVNISSLKGKRGKYGRVAACASKAGLLRLTETLALELGPHGINVNAICPGATVTFGTSGKALVEAMNRGLSEAEAIDEVYIASGEFPAMGALGRPGRPEEQASVVAFLVSREAGFITGQAINVCGGQLLGI